jgi:hypothetical protein
MKKALPVSNAFLFLGSLMAAAKTLMHAAAQALKGIFDLIHPVQHAQYQ